MPSLLQKEIRNRVRQWYVPLITGLLFIALGIYAFAQPVTAFMALAVLFSCTFILSGFFEIVFAVNNRHELENWGWVFAFGILNLFLGIVLFSKPQLSADVLGFFVAFYIIFRAAGAISLSIDLRRYGVREWWMLLVIGILVAVFGLVLLWNPLFAGLSLAIYTGFGFVSAGFFNLFLAFQLRKLKQKIDRYE